MVIISLLLLLLSWKKCNDRMESSEWLLMD